MYDKVKAQWTKHEAKLKESLAKATPEEQDAILDTLNWMKTTDMAVVVSQAQNEAADFLEKFQALIDEYNAGSANVEEIYEQLLRLAQSLNDEEQRHVREQLSDEELTVFDILTKPAVNITPKERKAVNKVAQDMLHTLKAKRLVLDWRKRQQSRAAVRLCIEESLDKLPRAYTLSAHRPNELFKLGGGEDKIKLRLCNALPAGGFPCVEGGILNAQCAETPLMRCPCCLSQAGLGVSADKHEITHVQVGEDEAEVGRAKCILAGLWQHIFPGTDSEFVRGTALRV